MRDKVGGNVALPAPRIFDSNIGKLRKNFKHILADKFGHTRGIVDKFMVFTAEKQSAVRTEAVIVQNMAVVAYCHIVADKPFCARPQGFGGNNKGADGNRLAFQRLKYRTQTGIGIDGVHQIFAFDAAFGRVNQPTVLMRFDARHRGLLENLRTGFGSGTSDAQSVIERMQVSG
ncbi:Uncharacterised protein [Neisseria meningitidis]|nr:Uncharacterised protein [Neisseria meningitidis]CWO11077.1 Uncharacterised protein [Neisseria meningitidis]CWR28034.1 Uncharacterised protein [Neisseria meningitidis]CWR62784.1 Uncharacterised protein [Neisseria meningitidis]CWS79259.1 Uncharacterised protein [Neisseria meningitidis]